MQHDVSRKEAVLAYRSHWLSGNIKSLQQVVAADRATRVMMARLASASRMWLPTSPPGTLIPAAELTR
jgi:hypothetical protein